VTTVPRLAGFIIPVVKPVDPQAPGSLIGPSARFVIETPFVRLPTPSTNGTSLKLLRPARRNLSL